MDGEYISDFTTFFIALVKRLMGPEGTMDLAWTVYRTVSVEVLGQ